jgi:hypothetical protein
VTSYEGLPPRGVSRQDARRFESECLEHVRTMLAPGAALRTTMERVAGKRLLSIEIDQERSPVDIVIAFEDRSGNRCARRYPVWGLDPVPPNPYAPHEAREVALVIAANAAEP